MAKDDISLGVELGRLEIQPARKGKNLKEENPFVHLTIAHQRKGFSNCLCNQQKKNKNLTINKRKYNKILKEPILKILNSSNSVATSGSVREKCQESLSKKSSLLCKVKSDPLNLCTLVDNCNQLKISGTPEHNLWKANKVCPRQVKEVVAGASPIGSCSQEALNPPCDVTIDELASYFETLVHIPKKMSSMAEMMYI